MAYYYATRTYARGGDNPCTLTPGQLVDASEKDAEDWLALGIVRELTEEERTALSRTDREGARDGLPEAEDLSTELAEAPADAEDGAPAPKKAPAKK